ncbi:YkuS family protein [Shouchella clausii]|uniref:YkuS family protein n=1 Tax=Shouchella clausii TaxID=79880 RepID=UPI000BA70452|nr:YkuS family protein [Shouchella clausii]PAD19454.1 hypothetical protein CHH73_02200 [Shouchella clausii]
MAKIGVQSNLSDVQQELQSKGYEVVQIENEQDGQDCECCIVSGRNADVAGISVPGQMSIIHAEGLSAEEIGQRVDEIATQH